MICKLCWLMTSWACCVCLFSCHCHVDAVFFRSFNRLLGDIYYDPLDVGLAFKQLSFTRQSELSTLDQPIFNSLYGQENGRLAAWPMWYWVRYSLQYINVISSWSLQLSLAGLPLLVGENKVCNICRQTSTLTPVNRLKSDSDRSFICCYLILQF